MHMHMHMHAWMLFEVALGVPVWQCFRTKKLRPKQPQRPRNDFVCRKPVGRCAAGERPRVRAAQRLRIVASCRVTMPIMCDLSEKDEIEALRELLLAGPRTERARPTGLEPTSSGDSSERAPAAAGVNDNESILGSQLTRLLQQVDGLAEAETLLRAELAQREEDKGAGDQSVLVSACRLAMLLQAKGANEESLQLYMRVMHGYEAHPSYGPSHPDTLIAVNNLAIYLTRIGAHARALPLLERVLAGDEAAHGVDQPSTFDSLYNVARLHDAMGDFPSALPFFRRELKGCANHYGVGHRETKESAKNLMERLERSGDIMGAAQLKDEYAL